MDFLEVVKTRRSIRRYKPDQVSDEVIRARDITGYFLLAMIMLAVVAETTLILGLAMRETGRKQVRPSFSNQR